MSEALAIPAAEVAQPAPQVVVAARELSRRYGEGETAVDALAGVSLAVSAGELTAVMGPSGSGKSTLMHILAGLDRPTAGQVWIDGTNITQVGDTQLTKLRRRHVGFIFQFFNLLPMLTAEENVVLPLELAGRKPERAWVDELLATSRPATSTRARARRSSSCCARPSRAMARRRSWSRTTRTRRRSPTAFSSSPTGASSGSSASRARTRCSPPSRK